MAALAMERSLKTASQGQIAREIVMRKIMVVVGHPQRATLCEALGSAYVEGARAAGHDVKLFALSELAFDPILREGYRKEQPLEPDLQAAYQALAVCDHLMMIFPLWCGDMPAILKGFIERVLQPDLIARQKTENAMNWNLFTNKSARVVITMGMPVSIYRWWYRGHALRLLTRNILNFIGIKPVSHTLYGMVATSKPEQRHQWLDEMRDLGKRGI
jgi:putative NADPH-quinone reductase